MSLSFLILLAILGAAADYPRPDLLIEPADLARPAVAGRYRILDTRGAQKYAAGHVPGAVWVDAAAWSKAFTAGQDRKDWLPRLQQLGIKPASAVVVYGDDYRDAARIWWILRYWGIQDARLLNGGWAGWQAANGTVTKDTPKIEPAGDFELEAQRQRYASRENVLQVLKSKDAQIIDARSEGEHCGTTQTAKRGGHVPGAKQLEWAQLIDMKSQRFKGPEELTRLFKDAGIDPEQPAVTYCQSGGRAAVMAFALELMGGDKVRNYYRSWAEWGNAEDTPVAKPEKK